MNRLLERTSRKQPRVGRRPWALVTSGPARLAAWGILATVTGLLVRGETTRPRMPEGVRLTSDLVYREVGSRRARLDVYRPETAPPRSGYPVVVAVHGGGWRGGGKGEYGRSLLRLVREGLAVVSVDYYLARPGAPGWPENVRDVRAALNWVVANAGSFQFDPDRLAVMGASAGGHLALASVFSPVSVTAADGPRLIDDGLARLKGVIDFYGPTDPRSLREQSPGAAGPVEMLTGGDPESRPDAYDQASLLKHVRPGGPRVLIFHGTEDPLVPIEQSEQLAEALRAAGAPFDFQRVEGARHGFGLRAGTKDFVGDVLEFLGRAWED